MRLAWLIVAFTALMVNGQESKPHNDTHTRNSSAKNTDAPDTAGQTVVVVNQPGQENNHSANPPRYLSRLFSPENLPNIALVMVGIAGIITAIYTLKRIGHQAVEMRLQRIEMRRLRHETRRQRHIMGEQLTAMQGQLTQMQNAGGQTDALIDQAKKQVAELHDLAEATLVSAEIAAGVAIPKLVIHEFSAGDTGHGVLAAMLQFPKVELTLKNYGQTPALLRSWSILFTCEELPVIPVYGDQPGCGIVLTHEVIQPGKPYTLTVINSWNRQKLSDDDILAIIEQRKILNAYGYVCYGDIFGNPLQRFKFFATALNMGDNWIDWRTEAAPDAYAGTDRFPYKNAQDQSEKAN